MGGRYLSRRGQIKTGSQLPFADTSSILRGKRSAAGVGGGGRQGREGKEAGELSLIIRRLPSLGKIQSFREFIQRITCARRVLRFSRGSYAF